MFRIIFSAFLFAMCNSALGSCHRGAVDAGDASRR
jgi:hypothetical protein